MALMTVAEAAKSLGVHPYTIRRWIADGSLPAFRVGTRSLRVDPDDVRKFVQPAR